MKTSVKLAKENNFKFIHTASGYTSKQQQDPKRMIATLEGFNGNHLLTVTLS